MSKHIVPVILENKRSDQWYVEPFVGGGNIIDKIPGNRMANDIHYYLIEMWKALQKGWQPPNEVSKEYYYQIKENQNIENPALVGFVGFLCSFGGKWWGGYASNKRGDNYANAGFTAVTRQIKKMKEVVFYNENYWDIELKNNSFIYCDPPYEGTTKYTNSFDHKKFWQWCRDMKQKGHSVLISEYNAPEDFVCLKEISHVTNLDKNSDYKRTEKLFTLK